MIARINGRYLVAAALVVVIAGCYLAFYGGSSNRTVTAYFSQAISVYKGTDVDVMGVRIGRVTAVVPDGDQVRVEMEYEGKYKLPQGVKAAVITPTLVADRFVQLAPAYGGGTPLASGGSIPLSRTAVPVELDKIYGSLADLTEALGPNGANKKGALSDLLHASAQALKGNGELGNETIAKLSQATTTLGDNSDAIFGTVGNLAKVTATLQANDQVVGQFMTRLSKVSTQLAGERGDLRQALVAIADALGVVRSFVHDNRKAVVDDVKGLTTTLGVLAKQKKTLATVLQLAPLGLGDLTDAFDEETGTVGIRLQLNPTITNLPQELSVAFCGALSTNLGKSASTAACGALSQAFGLLGASTDVGSATSSNATTNGTTAQTPKSSLGDLLGGTR